ncbi:multiubiquitin domain-containing protein [Gelidibacter sp. F63206]|uniref:multiubiquitin domain-containing protein n=1 Tax=Gelidibacter sp. F63206 TaxID=2926425 RepID=UPI001FF192C5|nr:multiubiquitin domain-containing protein [Gelidibacter sp. F63206]MCK0115126.1 multiubiquitin domain-containing protein [Gelidibacter sp. F63206]
MYKFKINNERFESSKSKITGRELLSVAQLYPAEDYELLYKINEKGFTPIQLEEIVDLKTAGIEGFEAKPYKNLKIRVDDKQYDVEYCFMTPIEIMEVAGINPKQFYLTEIRKGDIEVSFKDDVEHKIAITKNSCFISCGIEEVINCVIVNSKPKDWLKSTIFFEEVVMLAYGKISTNPNVIYTVNYINGVPSKPEGSMLKGDIVSVKNKMIFNVTETNKS